MSEGAGAFYANTARRNDGGSGTYPRYSLMYTERATTPVSAPVDEDSVFGFFSATSSSGTDAKFIAGILSGSLPSDEWTTDLANMSAGMVIKADRVTVKPGVVLDPIAQGSAPAVAGSLIYNTSTGELNYHDSSGWNILTTGSGMTAHDLTGAFHTEDATGGAGNFLKADSPTTFSWQAHGLVASDVGAYTTAQVDSAIDADIATHAALPNVHHAQVHTHDGDTLQLDGVNSDGGAFAFNTTGVVTFNQDVTVPNLITSGNVDGVDISATLNQAVLTTSSPTFEALTFSSAVFGTYIPYKVANTGIAPVTMSQFQSLRRGVLQTLHPLTGEKDHFYLIDKQSAWTIGSTGGTPSGENNMFNNQLDSNCLITVADLPYVLTITHSGTITATDVLYLEILGHRLSSGAFTLKTWKVEVRETAGSVWWTVLDRSGVTDPPNIAVPLWIIGMGGVDYKYIDGIRLTITSADGSTWAPAEIYLAKLALINTRPSGTPAEAIGALDIVGGTVYGNVIIIGGDLTAANIITAGNVDGVDVSEEPARISTEIDTDIATHAAIATAHHVEYTNAMAVAAVQAANPLTLTNHLVVSGASTSTFAGKVQINETGAGPFLRLGDVTDTTDPITLLHFNTERSWFFRKRSTGASTRLALEADTTGKQFWVGLDDGAIYAAKFLVQAAQTDCTVTLAHDVTVEGDLMVSGGNISVTNNNGGIDFNDVSSYWLRTATNFGLYWDTTLNEFQWHWAGAPIWTIDGTGNIQMDGDLIVSGGDVTLNNTYITATLANIKQAQNWPIEVTAASYSNSDYHPLIAGFTTSSNPTKPKVGIFARYNSLGSQLFFSTSSVYATGLVHHGYIDESGNWYFQGNLTLAGGNIISSLGNNAITIDSSGDITKLGQDTPSTNQYLQWDGSKVVWTSIGAGGPGAGTPWDLPVWDATGNALTDSMVSQNSVGTALTIAGTVTMSGGLSGVTTLSMGGGLSGVTTLAMGGTLTGVTTISASGNATVADIRLNGNSIMDSGGYVAVQFDGDRTGQLFYTSNDATPAYLAIRDSVATTAPSLYSNKGTIRFETNITPNTTAKTVDIGNTTYPWDEAYADNWNGAGCAPRWKNFSDPLTVINSIRGFTSGESEEYDEYHLKIDTLPDWVRPKRKAIYYPYDWKDESLRGKLITDTVIRDAISGDWIDQGREYILKKDKGRIDHFTGKPVKTARYRSDRIGPATYNDEDFEREPDGVSINKLLFLVVQGLQKIDEKIVNMEERLLLLESAS